MCRRSETRLHRRWCYVFAMSRETQAPLEAFEHLPTEEKRAFTEEFLRRALPFDSGPERHNSSPKERA